MILELGGVYKTNRDDRPYRIIGLDSYEVFYDCLMPHDNSWMFSGNLKKKCCFNRISSKLFAESSKQIDLIPLNEQELLAFRPDLPMRTARTNKLNWNSFNLFEYQAFCEEATKLFDNEFLKQILYIKKLVLIAYGNKGGLKKGTLISADNLEYFECLELIWKAKEIQESINTQISNGIGIYRCGFEKGLPSYYIGEYIDNTGICLL